MRKLLQVILPYSVKLKIRLTKRYFDEQRSGYNYANSIAKDIAGDFSFKITQPIKSGAFYENKLHNLKLVGERLNHLIIQPHEVFSFWKLVGKPTAKNNFKKGRNLIEGNVSEDFGGGICQFSSILYHLALQVGLQILERHPHSLDIYKEEDRFTPLGADSTVVYGYKDLQFRNSLGFPLQFLSEIDGGELTLSIFAEKQFDLKNVLFHYTAVKNGVEVETKVDELIIFKNFYKRL